MEESEYTTPRPSLYVGAFGASTTTAGVSTTTAGSSSAAGASVTAGSTFSGTTSTTGAGAGSAFTPVLISSARPWAETEKQMNRAIAMTINFFIIESPNF